MSVDTFLDFIAKLSSAELCAMAGVRGATISSVRGLLEKIDACEQQSGFQMIDPNNNTLKPVYHRVAVGAVIYDENMDRARFDREKGLNAYRSESINALHLLKPQR